MGDEDQSIYGFRAAYPDALMQFERTYPGARVLLMEENYRSTPEILRTADAFIRRNHDRRPKTIRPTRASGAGVHLVRAASRAAQYAWLILAAAHSDGQIAVLYRNNDSVLPLIDLLDRHGIPYRCRQTDDTFFTHRIVTDILDIIAFAHDGQNAEVFLRIYYKLGGGISKKEAEFACEKSAASGKPILQELLRFPQLPTFVRDSVTGLISLLPRLLTDPAQRGLDCIWQELRYRDYVERQQLDGNRFEILRLLAAQEPSLDGLTDRPGVPAGPGDPAPGGARRRRAFVHRAFQQGAGIRHRISAGCAGRHSACGRPQGTGGSEAVPGGTQDLLCGYDPGQGSSVPVLLLGPGILLYPGIAEGLARGDIGG